MPDARSMVASALLDLAQVHLEQGLPLPIPNAEASAPEADLIELLPLTVHVGAAKS